MAKKLVIFDFDGVLIETLNICFSLTKECNPDFTISEYKNIFSGNVGEALSGKKLNRHPDFFGRYDEMTRSLSIHDLLKSIVKDLSKKYSLSIVSSSDTSSINKILEKEKLNTFFSEILGMDVNHNKSEKISSVLKTHGVSPKDAVFITDTLGDILEANVVGVPSIAVSWGFHERSTFAPGHPAAIIDDPKDLIPTIEQILGK